MRIAAGAAVLVALLLIAAGCGDDGRSSDFNLKVGTLLPLTGQRDALGKASTEATKMAQAEIDSAIRKVGAEHSVQMLQRG